MYTYLVIGKGLFGSAAARYLSAVSTRVALVGPHEPTDWVAHDGVFASHYDEARIVSQSAPDEAWRQLDRASIAAYTEIEAQSGVRFFTPSGRLSAIPRGEELSYPYLPVNAEKSHSFTAATFPIDLAFCFPPDYDIVFEEAPSGYLNPRAMVQAQVAVAQQQGAELISQLVTGVQNCSSHVDVQLANGRLLKAKRVLLTTGAFANCFELLTRKLAVRAESVPTVLAEVSPQSALRLQHLPPLNYKGDGDPLEHLSILSPLRYPDGRYYIKVVSFSDAQEILADFDALTHWFRRAGEFIYLPHVQALIQGLLPEVDFLSWQIKPCVVGYTPSGKPMIDCLVPGRIYVAAGGNGGAAHPSDAIGKLAADFMIHNRWTSDMDHTPFQLHFADEWPMWMETFTAEF